jgi:hypothetical protein
LEIGEVMTCDEVTEIVVEARVLEKEKRTKSRAVLGVGNAFVVGIEAVEGQTVGETYSKNGMSGHFGAKEV